MSKFQKPNYTQVPNTFLDGGMAAFKEGELRVILVIMRETFGWHRDVGALSIGEMVKRTGLSEKGVILSIQSLLQSGKIERASIGNSFGYSLIFDTPLNGVQRQNLPLNNLQRTSEQFTELPLNNLQRSDAPSNTIKERKERLKKEDVLPEIPSALQTDAFEAIWKDWLEYRREKKNPVTARAARLQFQDLVIMGPAKAVLSLKTSIKNGWTGVFDPSDRNQHEGRNYDGPNI